MRRATWRLCGAPRGGALASTSGGSPLQPSFTRLVCSGVRRRAAAAALALQAGFTGVVGWNWLMGQPSLLAANATTTLNDG